MMCIKSVYFALGSFCISSSKVALGKAVIFSQGITREHFVSQFVFLAQSC